MAPVAAQYRMSASEFLEWDRSQTVKHEFVRGEVFAMTGAEERHVTVSLNVAMALRNHLRGTPCRTFIADMKLRVEAADCFYYPDVIVTCSAADTDPLVKREPLLVVEVLPPSTAAFDRGDKFADYRTLASLREYLLIDPATRRCDLYRRNGDGLWVLHPFEPNTAITLDSVKLTVEPAALWESVAPPGAQAAVS